MQYIKYQTGNVYYRLTELISCSYAWTVGRPHAVLFDLTHKLPMLWYRLRSFTQRRHSAYVARYMGGTMLAKALSLQALLVCGQLFLLLCGRPRTAVLWTIVQSSALSSTGGTILVDWSRFTSTLETFRQCWLGNEQVRTFYTQPIY